jgi:oligopeptide/dipeptide ABC transporter ATP-binding protein
VTPLLSVRDASLRYPGSDRFALRNASLEITPGEAVGIVGESGSGKTTLGRLLVGALAPTAGTVEVAGRPWSGIGRKDPARRSVQMIFQDPYGALNPWKTPIAAVAEVVSNWGSLKSKSAERRAIELLTEVGLAPDAMRRIPRKLSGGQCQRVGIARALGAEPSVLVADEPTSSLDVSVQGQILNLLRALRRQRELALVLISHDLAVVRHTTDRALVMYGGEVIEQGPTEALLDDPLHPYTRILVDSIPGREGRSEARPNDLDNVAGCVFAQQCPLVTDACLDTRPSLLDLKDRKVACLLAVDSPTPSPCAEHARV